ncbi:MAG: hypothetical protein CM15mP92_1280 [Halieaceae bacterium]|nr:MAG: hypothetical protein CM15mP92_1280 [Halieaceae bacterium]
MVYQRATGYCRLNSGSRTHCTPRWGGRAPGLAENGRITHHNGKR